MWVDIDAGKWKEREREKAPLLRAIRHTFISPIYEI